MDGLVDELLRLEDAKHKALVQIDPTAYDDCVREQVRALSILPAGDVSFERLLALSQLIQLNKRLLQNLVSTSPWFGFSVNGYSASGSPVAVREGRGVSLEA